MDFRIELVFIPVSDTDRAIEFYRDRVGFGVDIDSRIDEHTRFVQITPPGSAASFAFGEGIVDMAPGSQQGIQVVVDDAEAVYRYLTDRGVDASPVEKLMWGTFTGFTDPDGNTWAIQQLPPPGSYD